MLVPNRHASIDSYRYGFQGQEKDDEVKGEGNSLNYTFRMHDPRIGRFFAVDPLFKEYPELTPYQFASNSVIDMVEIEGMEGGWTVKKGQAFYQPGPVLDIFDNEAAARKAASMGLTTPKQLKSAEQSWQIFLARAPKVAKPQAELRSDDLEAQVNKYREVNPGLAISRGIIDGAQAAPEVILPEIAIAKISKAYKAYKVYKKSKIAARATKALEVTSKVDEGAYQGMEFLDDGIGMVKNPIELKSSKISSLVDKVFKDKAVHVIEGSDNSIHNWEALVPDKNPNTIKEIVKNVLENGKDVAYKRGQAKSMDITLNGVTREVQVPYFKGADGSVENFSSAFVK